MIRRSNRAAIFFLAPNIVGFLIFTFLPVLGAFALALFRWDIFHAPKFAGLANFRELLGGATEDGNWMWSDPKFWQALWNSFFLMLGIPISIALSLLLAVVLNQKLPGRLAFRTIFFLPTVCAGVGLLLLWKFLYNPQFGLINSMLMSIGFEHPPKWLADFHWAKPAIMLMTIWATIGGTNMILYLAGLQGIAPELYEAAQIDGAGTWKQFWHITLPMLQPTTFFIVTTSIIAGFQGEFDSAYVMTRGGPDGATTTLGYYIYLHAFEYFNVGYASAVALVMFAIILVVTLINWRYAGGRNGNV